MKKSLLELPEIKLVGISVRTNNAAEMAPETAKIGPTIQKFFTGTIRDKILNRKNPGKVFAVYTNYESDFTGNYTYFLGEEITAPEGLTEDLISLTIPAQTYAKFTSGTGPLPQTVIALWQKIWNLDDAALGGTRAYLADLEIYDERSCDPSNAVLDICIGLKKDPVAR